MRVCQLASGSRGNALFVEVDGTRLLIDAGLSLRELSSRLTSIGVAPESIHALLLSHEHIDHCRSIVPWARRYKIPLHAHGASLRTLAKIGKVDTCCEFEAGDSFALRNLQIDTIPLTHDAAACVGFVIGGGEGRVGVATDLGIATRLVAQRLSRCRTLVLEFNHDEELLRDGPYPWHLKQRIRSNHGHLSNPAAAELLDGLLWEGLEAVFLAHLSETNNTPGHALAAARTVLDRQNRCAPQVVVGHQHQVSSIIAPVP